MKRPLFDERPAVVIVAVVIVAVVVLVVVLWRFGDANPSHRDPSVQQGIDYVNRWPEP